MRLQKKERLKSFFFYKNFFENKNILCIIREQEVKNPTSPKSKGHKDKQLKTYEERTSMSDFQDLHKKKRVHVKPLKSLNIRVFKNEYVSGTPILRTGFQKQMLGYFQHLTKTSGLNQAQLFTIIMMEIPKKLRNKLERGKNV